MRFLVNERLSEHRYKTPEGYLVCTDAILARTGPQTYRRNEVFVDSNDDSEIEIDRKPEEVFSDKTLASFENKPITVEHPDEDVNVHNHKEYAVGFVRDVRRGKVDGQEVMLGNLVITDEKTIQEIEDGEHTDLSCGYDCDIVDEENPQQRNIRGNHVALCEQGRAGIARIVDSVNDDFEGGIILKGHYAPKIYEFDKYTTTGGAERWYKNGQIIAIYRPTSNDTWFVRKNIQYYMIDSVNDAKYHVGYVDRYDQACYVRVDAKDEKEAEEKVQKAYKPYRIFEVRKVSDSTNNIDDFVEDVQVFYALHTKYNDTYIATNLDSIKRMHETRGGDMYEVNDNFEFYKQTQSKWGQRALWDEIFSAIRNGKAKRITDNIEATNKDSVSDELVDIPNTVIEEFKNIVKSYGFEIEGSGHTMFGRLHFQIASKQENYTKAEFDKIYREITAAFRKFEDKYARGGRFPITWNFGLTNNGRITAGIDLDKILTKDSINDSKAKSKSEIENIIKSSGVTNFKLDLSMNDDSTSIEYFAFFDTNKDAIKAQKELQAKSGADVVERYSGSAIAIRYKNAKSYGPKTRAVISKVERILGVKVQNIYYDNWVNHTYDVRFDTSSLKELYKYKDLLVAHGMDASVGERGKMIMLHGLPAPR